MRGKRAFYNIISNIVVQASLAISGLIIPRLIMKYFGSETNGLVSSITQFISYAALIEMGIGNSSIIALYKPLADADYSDVSDIVASAKRMYLHSAIIYSVIIILLALSYPQLYQAQFGFWFIFDLILCIGSVNAIDYFILGQYKVLLIADQKYYILNIARTVSTIIMTLISVMLLINGYSILWTKAVAAIVHLAEAGVVLVYVRYRYPFVNYHSQHKKKIEQRWNALIHQLCSTITYNTDLVVLTLCLPSHSLLEISVYSVYSMIAGLINNMAGTLTTGINATFGNMLAKNEKDIVKKTFDLYEFFYFIILFILYSCFLTLVLPFISCYTIGMEDVQYVRLSVGVLFALNGLTSQIKEVSGVIINAAGRYKETQRYAIEEAVSNIIISLILVKPLGIIGVLIGTLCSHVWMAFRFIYYMEHNLIIGITKKTIVRIVRNLVLYCALAIIELDIININCSWGGWVCQAFVVTLINTFTLFGINILFENKILFVINEGKRFIYAHKK